ncbi:hypothetical protein Tco_1042311 [Tanacetum coccineum]|uniref:Uncharacterized protein n=1 Tax=Tanacetum coccineum TaxID=301880 RepID=A0ABQ5GIQ4_9ASTR
MNEYPELNNESYVLYDRVMTPLAAQLKRKPRRDHGMRRGRHSTSSSSAFDQSSSSHLNDDDDDRNDKGTSRASTTSPIRYVNSLTNQVPQCEDVHTTPICLSPTTTSLSPTPPNAPSKTTSTNQTSSSQENTSSSFHSKLKISPPSSHEPTSPHHLNPLLDNISDVSPRPLNPQPLQSQPSLDITLSLSLITLLDHIHDTPSPLSPPQPQPPIMGHLLFYNYHDYHGATCICLKSRVEYSGSGVGTKREGVDWTGHAEEEQENFALMAFINSGLETEVKSCSKEYEESYGKLKKLYDEQREQLVMWKTSNDKVEIPKIKTVRMIEPIIEEWESDSEDDEIVVKPKEVTKTVKPIFEKIESVNA